jgi:tetratricopeptide (TPR) repeat protein
MEHLMKSKWTLAAVILAIALNEAHAAGYCGELSNGFGPFDYTKGENAQSLAVVEKFHFTSEVERLISGASGNLGGDIDYTLRAFPNHSKALSALARLALREKSPRVAGAQWSVECYFNRAIRFKPTDSAVRNTYGSYLFKLGRMDEALEQLREAVALDPENATANNNLALLYMRKKEYDKAAVLAKKAESLGFPLTGVKDRLIALGKWDSQPKQ